MIDGFTSSRSGEVSVFLELFGNLKSVWFDFGNTARLILAIILAEFLCGVCAAIHARLKGRRNLYSVWIASLPVLTAIIGFGWAFFGFGDAIESLEARYRFIKLVETARIIEVGLAVSALLFAINAFTFYRRHEARRDKSLE